MRPVLTVLKVLALERLRHHLFSRGEMLGSSPVVVSKESTLPLPSAALEKVTTLA